MAHPTSDTQLRFQGLSTEYRPRRPEETVLAPHAKLRSLIVPKKEEPQPPATAASVETTEKSKRSKRRTWAELLARVFDIDVKKCSHCGGELKIIAAIIEVAAIRKILGHLGVPDKPPDIAPARLPTQLSFA